MKRGVSILEVVLVAAIILTVVTAIAGAWQLYLRTANTISIQTQATLAEIEVVEALNIMRDSGWASKIASLNLNTNYYIRWNGSTYIATSTSITLATSSALVGRITFQSIKRDAQSNISSSGTIDPDTRLVSMKIYPSNNTSNILVQANMLLHNLYDN